MPPGFRSRLEARSGLAARAPSPGDRAGAILVRVSPIAGVLPLGWAGDRVSARLVRRLRRLLAGASDYPARVQRARAPRALPRSAARCPVAFLLFENLRARCDARQALAATRPDAVLGWPAADGLLRMAQAGVVRRLQGRVRAALDVHLAGPPDVPLPGPGRKESAA